MDHGVYLQYYSAFTDVPKEFSRGSKTPVIKPEDLASFCLNPLQPNQLFLSRQLPSGRIVQVGATPKNADGSVEDVAAHIQSLTEEAATKSPDVVLNEVLAIAQRAYPIKVPTSFKADGKASAGETTMREMNVAQALATLKALDDAAVGTVSSCIE